MKTSVLKTIFEILFKKETHLSFLGVIMALAGMAQTYTTQADGDWSSPSTWAGGIVPATTIAAGKVVVIKNKVTFDQNNDLVVSGKLSITNDTLVFGSSYDKNIQVNAGGSFSVSNGVIIQDISTHKSNFTVNGGRVSFNKSIIYISRGFLGTNGGSRSFVDTKIYVGNKYELGGTSTTSFIDTVKNSIIQISMSESGDFTINNYGILKVANAIIKVENGNNFRNTGGGAISVLKGANSNYGFDLLKVTKDLQNDGSWNARIDAACISGSIKGSKMADIDFTRSQDCAATPLIGDAPELIFKNPVLKSGTANKQGAVYRFANVISGVDAEITLKKFSRSDIQMNFVDRPDLGWDKAFQPNFGLPGRVDPYQNWYVDFQVKFYKAGTNTSIIVPKVDMTALDVDGDGVSVSEYAVFQNPSNVIYSTVNYLTDQPAGSLGQNFKCPVCNLISLLIACPLCGGDGKTGMWNLTDCAACNATGLIYSTCSHPFEETNGDVLEGPVQNFNDIDTAATQVMATYQYTEVNTIDFRYGAKSGALASNGGGIRLNSLWFRQFSLSPPSILPVKLNNFSAFLNNKDVNLAWTANEENVSHYVVQRSTDGRNYSDIAIVFANNASTASTYKYKDVNVSSSTDVLYYRLLMIDNGKETGTYSPTRVIRLGNEAEALKLVTYPNPAKEQLRITLPSAWQGKPVMLQLYNSNGIMVQSMQLGNASQTETVQVGKLIKGFYLVKAVSNGEVIEQRIIKN
jgi:hypothetical protein